MSHDGSIPEYARGYEGFGGSIRTAMSASRPAWPDAAHSSASAPNVVLMVIDDMGFSDLEPYGGEVSTPHIAGLAKQGVVLNSYHTASLCSPARAALLSGINPHRAGFATVAEFNPGFPGYALELEDDILTLPEALRASGYATFAVGKWHLTRSADTTEGSSRRTWPTQRGFDRYYGCLGGMTSFFAPDRLVRDNSTVDVDRYPDDYYLTDDLTDEAIRMIRALRATDEHKPFFLYFAHNAMHGPLGAKPDDIAAQRGRFAEGWDVLRRQRLARQIARGLFPQGTRMVERNVERGMDVAPWDEHDDEQRARFERYMEVYAAMIANIDENLGRLLDVLDEYGERENTLILITSDNGGTAEGGAEGTRSYLSQFIHGMQVPESWRRDQPLDIDEIGGPRAFVHYPRGWAQLSNTPFRLYKGSTFGGGVRAPMIVSWPARFASSARTVHDEFMYATDVMPTVLDACGIADPAALVSRVTRERDGVSHWAALSGEDPANPRSHQYAESNGNLGFYCDGWKIVSQRPAPFFDPEARIGWQLFDVRSDPAETVDLAADHPQWVAELETGWREAAWRNTVFPIADDPALVGGLRPHRDQRLDLPLVLRPGTPTVDSTRAAALIDRRPFCIDIVLGAPASSASGVLVAHGDQGGGYVVYVEGGRVHVEYNEYGITHGTSLPLHDEPHIRLDALLSDQPYHWNLRLHVAEAQAAIDDVMMLVAAAPFTGIDIGIDRRGPVSWAMHERHGAFPFDGIIESITYTPGPAAPFNRTDAIVDAYLAALID